MSASIAPQGANGTPQHLYLDRMSRVDGCPEACGNVEPPRSVIGVATGYRAGYLCHDCGHAWTTDWADE